MLILKKDYKSAGVCLPNRLGPFEPVCVSQYVGWSVLIANLGQNTCSKQILMLKVRITHTQKTTVIFDFTYGSNETICKIIAAIIQNFKKIQNKSYSENGKHFPNRSFDVTV